MTMFALPLLVGVISAQMSGAVTSYWTHDWAYFVAAELLVAGALVQNEIRSRPPAALAEVAERLARAMAAQWSAEAAARKINDPVTLAVPWQVEWDPAGDTAVGAAEMSSIHELFSAIPARRLIVLGGPGAGKTAVLLDLVLKLLLRQDRETGWAQRGRSDRIVPVLFPLSSWSPDQALHEWLVDQLEMEYPELRAPQRDGPDAPTRARALEERDLILPVLAGLVAGLVGGFAAGLRGTPADLEEADAACGPAGLLSRDRGTWWLIALVGGGAFGLGAGMGVQVAGVGLAAGLTVGLIAASIQAAWLPFTIAGAGWPARGGCPFG